MSVTSSSVVLNYMCSSVGLGYSCNRQANSSVLVLGEKD